MRPAAVRVIAGVAALLAAVSIASAQGGRSHGDELIGLQRAFICAGAPAVVTTTLWKVDDRTSYEVVRAFPHPYAWAAFGLTGVPR